MQVLATQIVAYNWMYVLYIQYRSINLSGRHGCFPWCLSYTGSVWHRPVSIDYRLVYMSIDCHPLRGDGAAMPGHCQSLQHTCSAWQWGRRRQGCGLHCSTLQHCQNKGLWENTTCCCVPTAVQRQGFKTVSALRIFPYRTASHFPRGFAINRMSKLLIRH